MFEIKIKVNANGTLDWGYSDRLRLGTTSENQRIKLIFDIDDAIDSTYHYLKFVSVKNRSTYLFRVNGNEIVLNRSIQATAGVWLFSFITSDKVIVNNFIAGDYGYISEPAEAIVVQGILNEHNPTEEEIVLKRICEMQFTELSILDSVSYIGDYFMYNSKATFDLVIGTRVSTIGSYAFYDAVVNKVTFKEGINLIAMKENSFYHMTFNCDIEFPRNLSVWNRGVLQSSIVNKVMFQNGSKLKSLPAYAFREVTIQELILPDGLITLNSNAIKSCTTLKRLWIPKTITTTIAHTAISGCTSLSNIELESGFKIDAYFDNCDLDADSMVNMFYALYNRRNLTAGKLVLGSDNLAKLTETQKLIAVNKNWTLS